jgi:hypothetical protein
MGAREDSYDRIQCEIASEKAAALSRIAGTLEALIAELHRIAEAIDPGGEEDARRHREVRERALRYRWYLEVQREAVGVTRHDDLDLIYPIPAPLAPARPRS